MNGGMLWDRFHGNVWNMDLMSMDTMKEILYFMKPIVDEYEVSVNVEGGGNHAAMNIKGELFASMKRRGWKFDDFTGDIEGFCSKPCYKILFRTTPDVEKLIREKFTPVYGDRFQIISTFPGTVEVMDKNVTKGTGLAKIAAANNISMDEIIAFGDNENDNPLLTAAGWGVCLANGSDGTKAIADDVTEQDCFAGGAGIYLIEKYLKPNGLWNE
jgi:hydroxymethylpyrimidine pyrophosphatase-like HAD family hydrolase